MSGSILATHAAALNDAAAQLKILVGRVQAVADEVLGPNVSTGANISTPASAPAMGASSGLGGNIQPQPPTLLTGGSLGAIQSAAQSIAFGTALLNSLVARLEQL